MSLTAEQAYASLLGRVKEWSLLSSCASVLGWDERTYMPHQGSAHRAEQMALLARLTHEMLTAPQLGALLDEVERSVLVQDQDAEAAVNAREIRRVHDRAAKLPAELVEELARVTTRAQQVWQEARHDNDFKAFVPWLEKIVGLKRDEAQAVGFTQSPYDALLDEYEPGATSAEITRIFADLRTDLVPLNQAILASGRHARIEILEREFPIEEQRKFGEAAAAAIGFEFDAGRLDETTHPFCSGMGPGDCRITTRYNPRHFNDAFFGILHEAGHGIYEQGLDPAQFGTPLGSPASLGVHESQSRLWENQVGRSRAFWECFFPRAQQAFPQALGSVGLDEFYFAINNVKPSYIRVEADEATYNLHIILRFELEQSLIHGDLKPSDVPGAWDELFEKSFQLRPPTNALGCLQDIHWSMGGLGYFPTYTLGNLLAAHFMQRASADLGGLDADFRRGQFGKLKHWLNENIHRAGQRFRAGELCQKLTGQPLSHRPFMKYLRDKYAPLYSL
jgi:carboxypeptidase Taq